LRFEPTFYFPSAVFSGRCITVRAAHITADPEIVAAGWGLTCGTLLSPHIGHTLALPVSLLQHASEPHCIVLELVTALDSLAALSLPHAVAQYGAIDTPAVVDGIGHFTWQFTLLHEVILHLNHAGSNAHYYRDYTLF
jgi:hypothetical protein